MNIAWPFKLTDCAYYNELINITFFFFRSATFTPSTDTMMLTFFFLIFFTLNSYCKE